jgi:hypothetical protein
MPARTQHSLPISLPEQSETIHAVLSPHPEPARSASAHAFKPYIGPQKSTVDDFTALALSHPRFAALCDRRMAEEAHVHLVDVIGYEISRPGRGIGNRLRLGPKQSVPIRIDPDKVVGENSLQHGRIVRRYCCPATRCCTRMMSARHRRKALYASFVRCDSSRNGPYRAAAGRATSVPRVAGRIRDNATKVTSAAADR